MNAHSITAMAKYVLNGRVEGGECPDCENFTLVLEDKLIYCESCSFEGEVEEPDSWL